MRWLGADERFGTSFLLPNGKPAELYSAFNRATMLRHFKWMQNYDIDGVFVQRFIQEVQNSQGLRQFNTVLGHCREGANLHGRTYAVMYDLSGLGANQIGRKYLPVVFPGFSWHNLNKKRKIDGIPRQGGRFLWSQFVTAKKAGATMIYQAMFDEVDEGTAIYKVTNDPPVGESSFVTYEGLPSDHYLKLVGEATKMMAGTIPVTDGIPVLGLR